MPTADELARLRIEEEAKKMISTTSRVRKFKQRELVGEEAEEIVLRKDHVEDAKKNWSTKGTEGQTHGSETIEHNVATKAKQAYEDNIKRFGEKGKSEPISAGAVPDDLKKKFDKPAKVPALFNKSSIKQPKDSTPSNSTSYTDGFAKIEKQEEKMVGTSKHITTTGIDAAGRRVTKTKIILPEQVGETKAQHQQGAQKNNSAENDNKLMPNTWDGKYYSLTDIRQRKVDGIDKNNREQYLSPEDFEQVFKMSKEAFSKQPKWKRDKIKQDLNLF
jgi:hypothetical protein